jgi:hypothetical protein
MSDRRRFAVVWSTASALSLLAFYWMITAGTWDPFRRQRLNGDFYEVQARAMLHGNLAMSPQVLNIEAFKHHGKFYTYFPPGPAFLRMPIVAVTHTFDGRLSGLFMTIAFVIAMVGCGTLWLRVRGLARPDEPLGRLELACAGMFAVLVGVGSPMYFMASRAWLYHEAAIWAIAFAVCAYDQIVAFLGKPTAARLVRAAVFGGGALLSRAPIGAGALGALAIVLVITVIVRLLPRTRSWLARFGVSDDLVERRGWIVSIGLAVAIPVVIFAAFNYAKFQTFFSVPYNEQILKDFNAQRRHALAANGNSLFSLKAIPTQLLQLFRPDGASVDSTFPFLGATTWKSHIVGSVVFDNVDYTASLTVIAPLLLALSAVGVWKVAVERRLAAMRVPVIAAIVVLPVTLSIVFVAQRYTGDLLPPLVLLATAGFHAAFVWLRGWGRFPRRVAAVAFGVVVLVGCWSSAAVALEYQRVLVPLIPDAERREFVSWQTDVADLLGVGYPTVRQGDALPAPGPRNTLFVLGDCDGLYVSKGESWQGVERTHATGQYFFDIAFADRPSGTVESILRVDNGGENPDLVTVHHLGNGRGYLQFGSNDRGPDFDLHPGLHARYDVLVDPNIDDMHVIRDGAVLLGVDYTGPTARVTLGEPGARAPEDTTVHGLPTSKSLCEEVRRRAS